MTTKTATRPKVNAAAQSEVNAATQLPNLPGLEILGCGYDVTDRFADPDSKRGRIFSLGKNTEVYRTQWGTEYRLPDESVLDVNDKTSSSFEVSRGGSAEEYTKKLALRANVSVKYGLFSSDVTSNYSEEQRSSINHEFMTVHHRHEVWTLTLNDYESLPMLKTAEDNINGKLSAAEVFTRYGTHVLISGVIGGRAEYHCMVDRSRFTSEQNLEIVAKAAYGGVLDIKAGISTVKKETVDRFKENSTTKFRTVGGDFSATFDPQSFSDWVKTFRNEPVLIDFTKGSLVPIFTLAKEAARRKELEDAYNEYLQKKQLTPYTGARIAVRVVTQSQTRQVGSADRLGAGPLQVYRPVTSGGDWYWLGQSGNNNRELIIVQELVPGALAEPIGYTNAWDDAGRGKSPDHSLWNPVPPPGYRVLGGVARLGVFDQGPPSGDEARGLACVHESLCVEGKIGEQLWNDRHSRAPKEGGIWEILPVNDQGINARTFYCQTGWGKPNDKVYVLKKGTHTDVSS